MIDSIIHFLLLPVVGWIVILTLLGCTFFSVSNSKWGIATVLHAATVWFGLTFFNIVPSFDNITVLLIGYFIVGSLNSVLQWYFTVQSIAKSFPSALIAIVRYSLGNHVVDDFTSKISSQSSDDVILNNVSTLSLVPNAEMEIKGHDKLRVVESLVSAFSSALRYSALSHSAQTILKNSVSVNRHDTDLSKFTTVADTKILFKPVPSANKSYLISWIAFWPTVLIWTLISKPARYITITIYDALGNVYQKISDSAFK